MKQKVRKIKYILCILSVLLTWLFGLGITQNTILDRALIVGMSLDLTDEGKFKVGAQIIYPTGTSATNTGSQANLVVSEGDTIADAVNRISEQTGLFPSLSHCDIVFIGEKMFEGELERSLDYMVENNYLSRNSLLTIVKGEASEILKAKTDFTISTATLIKKEIIKNGLYEGIGQVSISDFYRNFYSDTEVNFLNIIKMIDPQTGKEEDLKKLSSGSSGGSSGSSGSSGGSGSTGQSGGQEKKYIFDVGSFMLIRKDKIIMELTYEESVAIDFFLFKIKRKSISYKDEVGSFELEVTSRKLKKTVSLEDMSIKYELTLKVILGEFSFESGISDPKILAQMDKLDKEQTRKIEIQYEDYAKQALEKSIEKDVDLFDFYGNFYRRFGKRFKDKTGEDYLKNIKYDIVVNIIFV